MYLKKKATSQPIQSNNTQFYIECARGYPFLRFLINEKTILYTIQEKRMRGDGEVHA